METVTIRGDRLPLRSVLASWHCRCGSGLTTKVVYEGGLHYEVVCAEDESHSPDSFLPKSVGKDKKKTVQWWYDHTKGEDMFVKDRHDTEGRIVDRPRVRRAGRISLGEQREGGGAKALPYFTFKAYEEGAAGQALLMQVEEAIEKYAPQESVSQPRVLPVFLAADNVELIAGSAYKLLGKDGHPRCVGDGETIQWKLGPNNLIEVSNGEVVIKELVVDGESYIRGKKVECPGRSKDGRWGHCESCRLQLEIDFQVAGLPYLWSLTTGDQLFYDQFFTVLEMMDGYIKQNAASFLPEIPLLLRRQPGVRARPTETKEGTTLTWQEMPTLTIEIHPIWKMKVAVTQGALIAPEELPQLEDGPTKEWYERAAEGLGDRPWDPVTVGTFVTNAMEEYRKQNVEADDAVVASIKKAIYGYPISIFKKSMEADDAEKVTDIVFWFLFGGPVQTKAQAAAIYRWAREETGDGGATPSPHFEVELIQVLDEAQSVADQENEEFDEEDDLPF